MILLSQDSMLAVDFTAVEIQQAVDENNNPVRYDIIAFGFNTSFVVASYSSIASAQTIFSDIMKSWAAGKEFYDIRAKEARLAK